MKVRDQGSLWYLLQRVREETRNLCRKFRAFRICGKPKGHEGRCFDE